MKELVEIFFLKYPCALCKKEGDFPKYQVLISQLGEISNTTGSFQRHLCPNCASIIDDFLMRRLDNYHDEQLEAMEEYD